MSNSELGHCARRELILLHQSLVCRVKHPYYVFMLEKVESGCRRKKQHNSNLAGVVFFRLRKVIPIPMGEKKERKKGKDSTFLQPVYAE